ncbi:MAG: recombinase family protein [Gammaproteobacteria bacterium]
MSTKVVGYCWQSQGDEGISSVEAQKQAILKYCGQDKRLLQTYVEGLSDKKHRDFPQFLRAILAARQDGAELVIAELAYLTRFPAFTDPLLASNVRFRCLDQPRIDHNTLMAVVENARYIRERHSFRIRQGLDQTLAQLGNPHAMQEISKVNKPKTESAVLFALILGPIIGYYRVKGYSQRKMMTMLNEEGFLAPEGGPWVLSQLQKVLERIDLNNLALDLCETLDEFHEKKYTPTQMVKALRLMQVRTISREEWDEHALSKVIERLETIREVVEFNQFVLDVYPEILRLQTQGRSMKDIAQEFTMTHVTMPKRLIWELEQDKAAGNEVATDYWDPQNVALALRLAQRRKEDIENYIHPDTLARAEALFKEFLSEFAH